MGGGKINVSNILKTAINIVLIALQFIIMGFAILGIWGSWSYIYWIIQLAGILIVLSVVYKPGKISVKLSWILFILFFPICGSLIYFVWGRKSMSKKAADLKKKILERTEENLKQDSKIIDEITANKDFQALSQINTVYNTSGFPVYKNTRTLYFPLGEDMFKSLKEELPKAKKFIFIEFFIISKGRMFEELFEILVEKSKEGVDIRILYDQVGSFMITPPNFLENCKQNGIKCLTFNPLSVSLLKYINYRDHRKIVVIDGNVGYTGGVNIGDEYINDYPKLGHWKDTGVLLRGDGVWSLTVLFLRMWDLINNTKSDLSNYRPTINYLEETGYVMPFGDGPTNLDNPAETNYKKMITTARDYIYITTPYLIIDSDMTSAFILAAKSGVDVRIITPFIPDKAFVHAETRSFYADLLEEGIKIYEYKPGFMHAKSIVCDDNVCFIGSVNFDYRSLMWNYECGVWVCNNKTVLDLKNDFLSTQEMSVEIVWKEWKNQGFFKKMGRSILRIISPLV